MRYNRQFVAHWVCYPPFHGSRLLIELHVKVKVREFELRIPVSDKISDLPGVVRAMNEQRCYSDKQLGKTLSR